MAKKPSAALRKELAFMEALALRCPDDIPILKALADLLTRCGRYEDGLKNDLTLARLCPRDKLVWYNLACSYALNDQPDEALEALERSIVLGYRDACWIHQDSDLDSIRQDARFKALVQRLAPESRGF